MEELGDNLCGVIKAKRGLILVPHESLLALRYILADSLLTS